MPAQVKTLKLPKKYDAQKTEYGTPLAALFESSREEDNAPAPVPNSPKQKGKFDKQKTRNTVNWQHELFGSFTVEVDGFDVIKTQEGDTLSFSGIRIDSEDRNIGMVRLRFKATTNPGVRLLHTKAEKLTDVTDCAIPDLEVEVMRKSLGEGETAVHTRVRHEDNIDLIFLNEAGVFVEMQIALATRFGFFQLSVQEIWSGQVARTTRAKAKEFDIWTHSVGGFEALVVPLYSRNAFPGSNYLKTFQTLGPALIDYAVSRNAVLPVSKCTFAKWEPNWELAEVPVMAKEMIYEGKGYVPAVVNFFNLIWQGGGAGYATLEDGRQVFLKFDRIMNVEGKQIGPKGEFPALEPMSTVYVKYQKGDRGLRATAILIP